MRVEASIIVNGHREGVLAVPSLRAAQRARSVAEASGIACETIYILDRPDQATEDHFRSGGEPDARTIRIEHGDLGLARNAGVAAASGTWIAFLDGDDLWGENWIREAMASARSRAAPVVWHPEINLLFGEAEGLLIHPDMEDPDFNVDGLAATNYWTALCFAPRQVLLDIPYHRFAPDDGIGFEDWSWNMEVIARGILHKVVPGTVHAVRRKPGGLSEVVRAAKSLPHSSTIYRDLLLRRGKPG